jgi:hypothetical protein
MNYSIPMGGPALRRLLRRASVVAAAPLLLGACDDLFNVDNPVDILEEDLDDPRTVPALSNAAEAAVAGAYDLAVLYGELVGDGSIHVSTNQGNLALDRGILGEFNERAEAVYNQMASARWTAGEVTRRLEALVKDPTKDAAVARSYYWDAVARITLADLHEEVPFDGGAPQTPVQVYEGAIQLLQKAADVAAAANQPNYVAAAYGTMARAYRSLYFERGGDISQLQRAREAALKALAIKADYRIDVRYQTPGSSNRLYGSWLTSLNYDVMDPAHAYLRDPASKQLDPRVKHGPAVGATLGDSLYQQLKYSTRDTDIRVASWQEAELVLAEHALLTGDLAQAVTRINRVRAAAGLPPFSATDAAAIRAQLIYERRAEFWLELRRWQDMRYYDLVPDRWNPAQKQAGVDRRFPVSLRERSTNPFYTGR